LLTEFLPLAADRRSHSGDDLLSFIASDPDLLLDDVVITAILIAVAGHETTANLLGAAMIRSLTPMSDGTRIVDGLDPADPSLITELLRLDSPVQATARTVTRDQNLFRHLHPYQRERVRVGPGWRTTAARCECGVHRTGQPRRRHVDASTGIA
jgi:cytochrome P450